MWRLTWCSYDVKAVQDVQITPWGSFALEVPNLNFRSFSLVSGEKVYSRDSEDCNGQLNTRAAAALAHHLDDYHGQRPTVRFLGYERLVTAQCWWEPPASDPLDPRNPRNLRDLGKYFPRYDIHYST